ncbi:MAG TPA: phage tail terminator-like protein [Brevundimonas sp.]|jgi:hypothetical protein
MNRAAIVATLRGPLYAANLGLPVAWPNVPAPGDAPRIDVAWADPDRTDPTLAMDSPIERGRMILTAVTPADEGEDPGNVLGDQLRAAYPACTRLPGAGVLVLLGVPLVRTGFRDGDEWRVPVVVPYTAYPA